MHFFFLKSSGGWVFKKTMSSDTFHVLKFVSCVNFNPARAACYRARGHVDTT